MSYTGCQINPIDMNLEIIDKNSADKIKSKKF